MGASSRIVSAAMRHASRIAAFAVACSSIFTLSACGSKDVGLAEGDPLYKGAKIFSQSCAGCHTLDISGTQGSAVKSSDKEKSDGPNFNQRRETKANILYALRNGGFSGKIMPQNIVTGEDADAVATFLAKYAGVNAANPAAPVRSSSPAEATKTETPADAASSGAAESESTADTEAGTGGE